MHTVFDRSWVLPRRTVLTFWKPTVERVFYLMVFDSFFWLRQQPILCLHVFTAFIFSHISFCDWIANWLFAICFVLSPKISSWTLWDLFRNDTYPFSFHTHTHHSIVFQLVRFYLRSVHKALNYQIQNSRLVVLRFLFSTYYSKSFGKLF